MLIQLVITPPTTLPKQPSKVDLVPVIASLMQKCQSKDCIKSQLVVYVKKAAEVAILQCIRGHLPNFNSFQFKSRLGAEALILKLFKERKCN